jgi:xanthine dehydrogenase accessory factor
MTELSQPLAVRREVCFCEAVYDGQKEVEGVRAKRVPGPEGIASAWKEGAIPLLVDPDGQETRRFLNPDVVVDAILAKRNTGTRIHDAPLVIGLGPGFTAAKDVHVVVETNRGHDLGRVLSRGTAEPDTGVPGEIGGFSTERVLRSPKKGVFRAECSIGDRVSKGTVVAVVDGSALVAQIDGTVRGLLRDGVEVKRATKVGDIDPRGRREHCFTISDKARAIGGGVLEAILQCYNR